MEVCNTSVLSDEPSKSYLSISSTSSINSCPSEANISFSSLSTWNASQISKANLIQKSGWLKKKSTKTFRRWHWRFFLLKNKRLVYFREKTDSKPRAVLDFDQISISVNLKTKRGQTEFLILPLGANSGFRLKHAEHKVIVEWGSAIVQHILASQGYRSCLYTKDYFWRETRISEQSFMKSVKTGDILLFQSKCIPATLQRTLARSKYDHVALLLKNHDEVGFLEATRIQGVSALLWTRFTERNWHLLYHKLVYRKLEPKLKRKQVESLDNFIDEVFGKGFRFKFTKRKKFSKGRIHVQENYFCSELVAACYQHIGILPNDIVPSYYWPKHFSSEKSLPLVKYSLSEEMLIDFEIK